MKLTIVRVILFSLIALEGVKYKLTLIADGKYDSKFTTQYMAVDKSDSIDVKLLRRGGFAASLNPIQQ